VGGIKDIVIDTRVIAATNRNLQSRIANGSFREDLFYRLNVFPIHIPPLRERTEDIPVLAAYFLDSFSRSFGRNFGGVSPDAAELMKQYAWPGNIRELRNVIERICIMKHGPVLLPEYLPPEIVGISTAPSPAAGQIGTKSVTSLPDSKGLEEAVADFEKNIISQALRQAKGNVLQTASILKIPRGTLRYKMDKFGL
jgi:DNA-binding NtrC family response regulator